MSRRIRVLHIGLGPIGQRIARLVAMHPCLYPVGGLDISADLVGHALGEIIGLSIALDAPIVADWEQALAWQPDIALHATGSRLTAILPQLLKVIEEFRIPVISTCEELSYPWFHHPDEARRLDEAARRAGVVVLGTGINPGFIMDALPLALSGVCSEVTRVYCRRVVDLSQRRRQLQQKVGVGLSVERFQEEAQRGTLGHVGLPESVAMLAAGLGWPLSQIEQTLEPVIAQGSHTSALGIVLNGGVIGLHQVARGLVNSEEKIRLELTMTLDAKESGDFIELWGPEHVSSVVRGVHGDAATAAIVVNMILHVLAASPGLQTMLDLPMPHSWRQAETV
jgi:hypothetical protein